MDMGAFTVPPRKDSQCSTLDHLDLTTDADSRTPETAFPTMFGNNFKLETVLAVYISTATNATSLPTPVPANVGLKKLGHPHGKVMA